MNKNHLAVMEKTDRLVPQCYKKFPVIFTEGNGAYLYDINGKQYLDMLAGYGALNFGHNHLTLQHAFLNQFGRVALISCNFYNDTVAEFIQRLAMYVGLPSSQVLMMNTGAEAVEKAIKICRRWGYRVRGVPDGKAEILVSDSNFHGRTYGVLSASWIEKYKKDFGPFMPGFKYTRFGNISDLVCMVRDYTVAFIVEPIQGEGGFIFPSDDYLKKAEKICRANNVLFVLDEIPTAFGRIGNPFPHFYYGLNPDMVILGKALGGGIYPVSAVVASKGVMDVLDPGSDGSTFGGNPLAAAMGLAAIRLTQEENLAEKARIVGSYFIQELKKIKSCVIKEVRGLGLFVGVELYPEFEAREVCGQLIKNGVVTAPARNNVVRFTPPLTITKGEINMALEKIGATLRTGN